MNPKRFTHRTAGLCALSLVALSFSASAFDKAVVDKYSSVTNFALAPHPLRNSMKADISKAARSGDMETLGKLLELLAKDGKVEMATFDLWRTAAGGVVESALEQRKKKPQEQKEIIAGFREGGTTFGFWQGADGLEKLDKVLTVAGRNILEKMMPQKGLSRRLEFERDQSVLNLLKRAESPDEEQVLAAKKIRDFAMNTKPLTQEETNAVSQAMSNSLWFLLERGKNSEYSALAKEFCEKQAAFLKARGEYVPMQAREAAGYFRAFREKDHLAAIGQIEKMPLAPETLAVCKAYVDALTARNHTRHEDAWREAKRMAKPLYDKRRDLFKGQQLLDALRFFASVARSAVDDAWAISAYNENVSLYNAMTAAWEAENAKERAAREKEKVAAQNKLPFTPYVRDPLVARVWDVSDRNHHVNYLRGRNLNEELVKVLESTIGSRSRYHDYWELLMGYAKTGRNEKAIETCGVLLGTNLNPHVDVKFQAAALKETLTAKDMKDLRAKLLALRPLSDGLGAKEGETMADKDARFFTSLRKFSRTLYNIDPSIDATERLKTIQSMTWEMLWPEEKIAYTAKYLENAPRSAEAAYRANVFGKLKTENRFARYGVYSHFNRDSEVSRLKSKDAPHLAADAKGKEGLLALAYDERGLHLYLKVNDPDAWKTRDGIAGGVTFEHTIMPGEDRPWHWSMFNTAGNNAVHGVVWDSPRKGFKVGMEYIVEDAYVADDCHVLYFHYPWILFPYDLPSDKDSWRLALVGGWAGQFGALGGGAVHELGRGMQISFDVPKQVERKLKLALLRSSVREYRSVRGKFENADFWVDPHLGDKEFHSAVVSPYLKELDAVANEIASSEFDLGKVDGYVEKYLFDLADFRLALDAKRAEYLKNRFFGR